MNNFEVVAQSVEQRTFKAIQPLLGNSPKARKHGKSKGFRRFLQLTRRSGLFPFLPVSGVSDTRGKSASGFFRNWTSGTENRP
jgi:hypothetical protein